MHVEVTQGRLGRKVIIVEPEEKKKSLPISVLKTLYFQSLNTGHTLYCHMAFVKGL